MRVMLEKVPEDWVCQQCAVLAETEIKKETKSQNGSKITERTSQNEITMQSVKSGASGLRSCNKYGSEVQCSTERKRKRFETASPHLSSRRSMGGPPPLSETKTKSVQTSVGQSSASMVYSKNNRSTPLDLGKWRTKPAHEAADSGSQPSACTMEVQHPQTSIGLRSHQSHSPVQISKSKLFYHAKERSVFLIMIILYIYIFLISHLF